MERTHLKINEETLTMLQLRVHKRGQTIIAGQSEVLPPPRRIPFGHKESLLGDMEAEEAYY